MAAPPTIRCNRTLHNLFLTQVWGTRLRPRLAHSSATPASPRGERGRHHTHDQSQHAAVAGLVHPASSYGDPKGLLAVLVVPETLRAGGGRVLPQVPVCLLWDQVPTRPPGHRLRCGRCCEGSSVEKERQRVDAEHLLHRWRREFYERS